MEGAIHVSVAMAMSAKPRITIGVCPFTGFLHMTVIIIDIIMQGKSQ